MITTGDDVQDNDDNTNGGGGGSNNSVNVREQQQQVGSTSPSQPHQETTGDAVMDAAANASPSTSPVSIHTSSPRTKANEKEEASDNNKVEGDNGEEKEHVEQKEAGQVHGSRSETETREEKTNELDEPSMEAQLLVRTDELFLEVEDKSTVTVKDFYKALHSTRGGKLDKQQKQIVKQRLTDLMTGKRKPLADSDDEEEEEVVSPSEEEEEEAVSGDDYQAGDDDEDDYDDDELTSSTKKKSRKKAGKKSATKARRGQGKTPSGGRRPGVSKKKAAAARRIQKQIQERRQQQIKVRQEELLAMEQNQRNEQDRKTAADIAAKFDTQKPEQRVQRLEKRLDLLEKLDQKRINILATAKPEQVVTDIKKESDEKRTDASGANSTTAPAPTSPPHEESSDDDDDDDMELEFGSGDKDKLKSFSLLPSPSKTSATAVASPMSRLLLMSSNKKKKNKKVDFRAGDKQQKLSSTTADGDKNDFWTVMGQKPQASPGRSLCARATLRSTLLSQQRKMGNMWLARELGYKNEQEHVQDCLEVERRSGR